MTQIIVNNVQKVFSTRDRDVHALKDINLVIEPGEFVCLLGRQAAASPPCSMPWPGFPCPAAAASPLPVPKSAALGRSGAWCSRNTPCFRG